MDYSIHNNKIANQYDIICDEFNNSRYRIWNTVKCFLDNCKGNNILDVGVGNGKNILYVKNKFKCIGIDISKNLLNICLLKDLEVYYKDVLDLKSTDYGKFDNIICIAVIHHIETIDLQKKAIINMLNCLNNNGKLLLSVWSYEINNINIDNNIDNIDNIDNNIDNIDNIDNINNKKTDIRYFKIGPNMVEWKYKNKENIINRFYYIHDYTSINNLLNDISKDYNIKYTIKWELQNWFCIIVKNII
jgi:ubiquinone/menaquinone biosynthesis C-methylase UbiE